MGIDLVGMDFEDTSENYGRAIKLVFQRDQSDKVRHRKLVGNNDIIIRNKGDIN